MRIKKSSIEHIIRSVPLHDHLKNYMELKRSGMHYVAKCAFHQDQSPSMYVYPDHYYCFSCKAHGSIIQYEMHRSGSSFKETVEHLGQIYRVPIDYEENENYEKYKEKNELLQKQEVFLQGFYDRAVAGQDLDA